MVSRGYEVDLLSQKGLQVGPKSNPRPQPETPNPTPASLACDILASGFRV